MCRKAQKGRIHVTVDLYPYLAASLFWHHQFLPQVDHPGGKRKGCGYLARRPGKAGRRSSASWKGVFHKGRRGRALCGHHRGTVSPGGRQEHLAAQPGAGAVHGRNHRSGERWGQAQATCISFAMCQEDVDYMLSQRVLPSAPMAVSLPLAPENEGKPHPRNFGTFPCFLRLAREKGFCTLEEAVHGSWPFGLDHRPEKTEVFSGQRIQAGITVFDGEKVTDKATYETPSRSPKGFIMCSWPVRPPCSMESRPMPVWAVSFKKQGFSGNIQ